MSAPSISPLSTSRPRNDESFRGNPPTSFQEPSTPIRDISIRWRGEGYARKFGNTSARDAGLRFEAKVQLRLLELYPLYEAEPHIVFWTPKGPRNAFPDGLLLLPDKTIVVEIKRQHMPEAWWQLRRLYQPVMEAYRMQPVRVLEIVESFDSQIEIPEPVCLTGIRTDLGPDFNVHIWRDEE